MRKEIKNVEFNAAWKNGTGYFDGAVNYPALKGGACGDAGSVDQGAGVIRQTCGTGR